MITLTLGLLRLANALPALVAAILNRGAAARPGSLVRAFPAAIPPATLVEATIALGLAAAAVAVRRAGGLGATLAAVTGRRDPQLTSKQTS